MARNPVQVRDALPTDADVLAALWRDNTEPNARPSAPDGPSAARAIGQLDLDPDQRLLLAVVDDEVVGAAHLVRAPYSPIHEETVVRVGHLFVAAGHRRRGVGRTLLAAAAAWADEKQTQHLMTTVPATARDANRFLARLGLASMLTVRATSVAALQERLAKFEASDAADSHVMVERLRTLRRRQASARAGRHGVVG
ncbi:MAG: GNAT family N-acetyltransferase [Nocardioidaceae bacterium]